MPVKKKSNTSVQTPPTPVGSQAWASAAEFRQYLRRQACAGIRQFLEGVMLAELEAVVGAAWGESSSTRKGYRNGYRKRDLLTREGLLEELAVPRDREGRYQTQLFERYSRYEPEVREGLVEMYVGGASQAKVAKVAETLTGQAISASAVSRLTGDLAEQFSHWQNQKLAAHYKIFYADAIHYQVRHHDATDPLTVLAVLAVAEDGHKELIGLTSAAQEDKVSWWHLFNDLQRRGVSEVDLIVTDGHQGLLAAADEVFSATPRQRCLLHKIRNIVQAFPKRLHRTITVELKGIWEQPTKVQAQTMLKAFKAKYLQEYPQAISSLSEEEEKTLTFYDFPPSLHRYIRTTNPIESMFSQVRDRTDGVDVFTTEQSCLLLVWATAQGIKFQRLNFG